MRGRGGRQGGREGGEAGREGEREGEREGWRGRAHLLTLFWLMAAKVKHSVTPLTASSST